MHIKDTSQKGRREEVNYVECGVKSMPLFLRDWSKCRNNPRSDCVCVGGLISVTVCLLVFKRLGFIINMAILSGHFFFDATELLSNVQHHLSTYTE